MADVEMRFFCHQCSRNIPRVSADYTCPTCNSGERYKGRRDKSCIAFFQGLLRNLAREQGRQVDRLTIIMRIIRMVSMTSARCSALWSTSCLVSSEGAWASSGRGSTSTPGQCQGRPGARAASGSARGRGRGRGWGRASSRATWAWIRPRWRTPFRSV